jgi:hypothetical protein
LYHPHVLWGKKSQECSQQHGVPRGSLDPRSYLL